MSFVCENEYCYKNNKKYKCSKKSRIECGEKQCHKYIKRYDDTELFSNEYAANDIFGYQCTKMEDSNVPEDFRSVSDFHTDMEKKECSSSEKNAYKTLKDMNLSENPIVKLSKEVVEIKFDRKDKDGDVSESNKKYSVHEHITISNVKFVYLHKFNNGFFSVVPYYVNIEQNIHIAVKFIYVTTEKLYQEEKDKYKMLKDIIDIKMIFVDMHKIVIMDKYNMNLSEFMEGIKTNYTMNIINYLKRQLIKILKKAYVNHIVNNDIKLDNILVICNKNEFKVTFGDIASFIKRDSVYTTLDNMADYIETKINRIFKNYEEKMTQ
jgi:hypothetical protein